MLSFTIASICGFFVFLGLEKAISMVLNTTMLCNCIAVQSDFLVANDLFMTTPHRIKYSHE